MKQRQNISFKFPIFSWLFFLFLSSGISYYQNNLQFGKPVLIERVDQLISKSGNKKRVAEFSVKASKSSFSHSHNSQLLRINLLSRKLDNLIIVALKKRSSLFKPELQNTILHFGSRKIASNFFDDFPDFNS